MSNAITSTLVANDFKGIFSILGVLADGIWQILIPFLNWIILLLWLLFQILLVPVYFMWVLLSVPLRMIYVGVKILCMIIIFLLAIPLMTVDLLLQCFRGAGLRSRREQQNAGTSINEPKNTKIKLSHISLKFYIVALIFLNLIMNTVSLFVS